MIPAVSAAAGSAYNNIRYRTGQSPIGLPEDVPEASTVAAAVDATIDASLSVISSGQICFSLSKAAICTLQKHTGKLTLANCQDMSLQKNRKQTMGTRHIQVQANQQRP